MLKRLLDPVRSAVGSVAGFLRALRVPGGAAGRALLALSLVAVLATGGWFVVQQQRVAGKTGEQAGASGAPLANASRVPEVLRAAAPIKATAPGSTGPQLSRWAKQMAKRMDIPARALAGYALAELKIRKDIPGCHLSWVTLAGIGATGSNHGRDDGNRLLAGGELSSPLETLPLRGPDGKTVDSRSAIGPMQLPVGLWDEWRRSENGKPNPQDIDDAALTTGTALCADGRDTGTGEGWWSAIKSVRDSDLFLQRVLANANVYGTIATTKQPLDGKVLTAVRWAISKIGLPYVWGGNGLESGDAGFDCSGLTKYSYQSAGVGLPRTAHTQYLATEKVPPNEEPRLGDLVFYGSPQGRIHHVGMYIGNGQMINAPTFGMAVQIHSYRTPGDDYAGAGRPVG
jgi:cell wall-associated NlpC family hydrolase